MNDHNLITIDSTGSRMPATADQVLSHVKLIDELLHKVMKKGVHYDAIPGCGDKPALLKPGAEKVCLTFRLAQKFETEVTDLGNGHRQYLVNLTLLHNGTFVGQGIGVCTTMEGKYRYRWDATGVPVPQEYWDDRDTDLLGGANYAPRKVSGKWMIFRKVEHDNPADYYNTCVKMARKRAHVDATISSTAASDIFEQGEDDLPGANGEPPADGAAPGKPRTSAPKSRSDGPKVATEKQQKLISVKLNESGIPDKAFLEHFKIGKIADLPFDQVNAALAFIKDNAP